MIAAIYARKSTEQSVWHRAGVGFAVAALISVALAGCADKRIKLSYSPDASLSKLDNAHPLTVFQFRDTRGDEGDADRYRVGGTYGGYGNRLGKVMSETPWQRTLQRALAEAFQTRGVVVTVLEDREYATGGPFATPVALAGDIRNFSTESRWSMASHVSGIVRLYDTGGRRLVEKTISARGGEGLGAGVFASGDAMQDMMNQTLAAFVHKVVTDPEILAQLQGLAR